MTNQVIVTQDKMAGGSDEPAALPPTSDKRMQLFNQLKPYTSQLLRARDVPARLQSLLVRLQHVIRDADLDGLNSRGILDYILFPLMPGVDSVVLIRRPGMGSGRMLASIGVHRSVCGSLYATIAATCRCSTLLSVMLPSPDQDLTACCNTVAFICHSGSDAVLHTTDSI